MKITANEKAEDMFYERLQQHMAERERVYEEKIFHVSNILSPRQWYWKQLKPMPLQRKDIGFFLAGQAHHLIAEIIIAGDDGVREADLRMKQDGITIVGHPDVLHDTPTEFKTSRKWSIPETPASHYIDQLLMYCVIRGVPSGKIVVFYLTPGRNWKGDKQSTPILKTWDVEFTEQELAEGKAYAFRMAKAMTEAKDTKNHTVLPLCEDWMCGSKQKDGVHINCPYYNDCQPEGRWPEKLLK
jgi:hypothetical protein